MCAGSNNVIHLISKRSHFDVQTKSFSMIIQHFAETFKRERSNEYGWYIFHIIQRNDSKMNVRLVFYGLFLTSENLYGKLKKTTKYWILSRYSYFGLFYAACRDYLIVHIWWKISILKRSYVGNSNCLCFEVKIRRKDASRKKVHS